MARINSDPKTSAPARTGSTSGPTGAQELEGPPAPTLDEVAGDNGSPSDRAASFGGGSGAPLGAQAMFGAGPMRTTVTFSPSELASINQNLDASYGFELAKHAKLMSGQKDLNALPPEQAVAIIGRLEDAEVAFATGAVEEGNALLIDASELANDGGVSLLVDVTAAAHAGTQAEMQSLTQSLLDKGGELLEAAESFADATTRVPAKYGQRLMAHVISKAVDIDKLPTDGFYEMGLSAEVSVNTMTIAMENKISVQAKEVDGERVYVVSQEIKAGEGVKFDAGGAEAKAMSALVGKREWVAASETEALEIMAAMGGTLAEGRLAASGHPGMALAHHILYPQLPKPSAFEAGAEVVASVEAELHKRLKVEFSGKAEGRARLEQNPDGEVTKLAFTLSTEASAKLSTNLLAGTEGKLGVSTEAQGKRSVIFTLDLDPPSKYSDLLDRLESAPLNLEAVAELQASGPIKTGLIHAERRKKIASHQVIEALTNDRFHDGPTKVDVWRTDSEAVGLDLDRGGTGLGLGVEFKKATPVQP